LLVTQINYVEKGMETGSPPWAVPDFGVYNFVFMNHYIEIPLFIRWQDRDSTPRWFLECGATIAYLMSAKVKLEHIAGAYCKTQMFDRRDLYRDIDFTLSPGAGLEFQVSRSVFLVVAVHYSHGILDLFKEIEGSRSRGIQPTCGIVFEL
jgi:hypothetical protein